MGCFLPKMPVAFRADSDFKPAERSSATGQTLWSLTRKWVCVFPFPFSSSHFPAYSRGLAMHMSLGVLFLWKLEIVTPGVKKAFPSAVSLTVASISVSLDCNSAQGSSRGGLHLKLIYALQNTVSCILEKKKKSMWKHLQGAVPWKC